MRYTEPFDRGAYVDLTVAVFGKFLAFSWKRFVHEFQQMRKPLYERIQRDDLIHQMELFFSVEEIRKICEQMQLPWKFPAAETDQYKVAGAFVDPIWRKGERYFELVQLCMKARPGLTWRRYGKGY